MKEDGKVHEQAGSFLLVDDCIKNHKFALCCHVEVDIRLESFWTFSLLLHEIIANIDLWPFNSTYLYLQYHYQRLINIFLEHRTFFAKWSSKAKLQAYLTLLQLLVLQYLHKLAFPLLQWAFHQHPILHVG